MRIVEFLDVTIEVMHPQIIERFPNLSFIDLWGVKMERFTRNSFRNCQKVKEIAFRYGNIEEIPAGIFRKCNLTYLALTYHQTRILHPESFEGLSNLQSIDLSRNNITSLPPGILSSTPNLKTIYLYGNQIAEIQANIFPHKIRILHLNYNNISEVHPKAFEDMQE